QQSASFGTQSGNTQYNQAPQQQQVPSFGNQHSGGLLQIDPAHQQQHQSGYGSQQSSGCQQSFQSSPSFGSPPSGSSADDAPKTEEWSQNSSADSGINMGNQNAMTELRVETDGGGMGMYKLPVKIPQESPRLIATGPIPRLEDWKDYDPPQSNFGTYVIPDRPARGGFRGGPRGGGGRGGGYDGGRGGGRGRGGF
ncbi:hypothetical protein PFISCL1PPCAC_541, partial [Pristionchus fissidentatus]